MASRIILAAGRSVHLSPLRPVYQTSYRSCGWVRDWKPGPPTRTEEERIAAAKKYNLIPEDYIPFTGDEASLMGDYPNLAELGMDARDPYEDMDNHYMRRNYGEYIHLHGDYFTADRHDPNEMTALSGPILFLQFLAPWIIVFILLYITEYFDLRLMQAMKPKQYPGPGKVHYTFEPLD